MKDPKFTLGDPSLLYIVMDADEGEAAPRIAVTSEESPTLFEAWRMWRVADAHSAAERSAWELVMDCASAYTEDGEHQDRLVIDVDPAARAVSDRSDIAKEQQ